MIIGVHGIRCYRYFTQAGTVAGATEALAAEWAAALGLPAGHDALRAAYYAPLLHLGATQGPDDPELLPRTAQGLLVEWVSALGAPAEVTMGPGTLPVRQAVGWIAERFGETAKRFAVLFCREVDTYVTDPASPHRASVQEEVRGVLAREQPRVVIAHSLGSVVAYETLWHHPVELDLLITLGSPLGLPNVIFDRLSLGEGNEGRKGLRPPGVRRWVNIADVGDIVAQPRDLPGRFPGIDAHHEVALGLVASHRATQYLARTEVAAELARLT